MPVTSTYISTPGLGGAGAFHRGGSGEPLLCVHGITDTWRSWELVAPLLEPHHDLLAITLRGHSGGRALEEGGHVVLRDLVDEAERDMDAAGFETAHLVGNSLGGWIVLELAARGRARSVTALAPAGGWEVGDPWAYGTLAGFLIGRRLLRIAGDRAPRMAARPGLRKLMLKSAVSDPVAVPAPLAASLIRGAQDCPALLPLLAETRIEGFPAVDRGDCPTRIVWGTRDRILPPKHLSARFREMLPDAEWVEIPGGGHIPQIDHPERVAELVLELTGAAGSAPGPA
ncbi:MAG: alpha/beta fold hydrolase [Solirubrobacterales bacterium]|nr:alpha/beta fold hydrolase [Solirubrobacterales bacterium]MCB8971110.1 alpha/beta fold hydrolase [Thermoleophilales bacterium]